ncbi:MAG: histidine phosphatase family protein [Paracoccaceae bacterium]
MTPPPADRPAGAELVLIRHAPIAEPGRLCGRTDLPARLDFGGISKLSECVAGVSSIVTSPALRCRQTAAALWPGRADPPQDPRLWEQDFGAHDGLAHADLPDLGVLNDADLAAYRPPGGESFDDLCARLGPALRDHARAVQAAAAPRALVVHAGVIRAALALALGTGPAALRFEIAPLSVTRLRVLGDAGFGVIGVNRGFLQ